MEYPDIAEKILNHLLTLDRPELGGLLVMHIDATPNKIDTTVNELLGEHRAWFISPVSSPFWGNTMHELQIHSEYKDDVRKYLGEHGYTATLLNQIKEEKAKQLAYEVNESQLTANRMAIVTSKQALELAEKTNEISKESNKIARQAKNSAWWIALAGRTVGSISRTLNPSLYH